MTAAVPVFLRYELDADGHAYQRLALGEESLALYPVLDPISIEHALEVEKTILPAIVALYAADPSRAEFDGFRRFRDRFRALAAGTAEPPDPADDGDARALDALRAAINDYTPPEEIERRAFACFYRHASCDNDVYREKAHRSLERLITRLSEIHAPR